VFREVCGEGYIDRDLAFWRWEFLANPQGHRIWVAMAKDGVVAAHYGGVPYAMATSFGDCVFVHIVDSYSHPAYRRLRRPGLFVLTGQAWTDDCRRRGDATAYGYPVMAAQRVGSRFLDYTQIRVVDYQCRALDGEPLRAPQSVTVERVDAPSAEVDALFSAITAEKACLTRRDSTYLAWRYVQIPGDDYEIWEVRRSGELVGLMVLRPVHELIPGVCTVADWLVREGDDESMDALLAAADERGRALARQRLMAVFPTNSFEYAALGRRGFAVEPSASHLERRLNHIPMGHPVATTDWLADNWWYTLGDSDLV
jgi:hypothetical protein